MSQPDSPTTPGQSTPALTAPTPPPGRRPALVTTAAVMSLLSGGVGLLAGLLLLPEVWQIVNLGEGCAPAPRGYVAVCRTGSMHDPWVTQFVLFELATSIVLVVGAVLALQRRTPALLQIGALASIVSAIWFRYLNNPSTAPGGGYGGALILLICLATPSARTWFRAGRTNVPYAP